MPQLVVALIVLLVPAVGHAYIGPGAGLTAIGSLIALVGTIVLAIIGFVWFPIKRLMRMRAAKANATIDAPSGDPKRG
jgi:hypothetical protein